MYFLVLVVLKHVHVRLGGKLTLEEEGEEGEKTVSDGAA